MRVSSALAPCRVTCNPAPCSLQLKLLPRLRALQFKDELAGMMETVTDDYLNNLSKSIWSFASHYGHEGECLAEADASGELWGWMGPTRCTAIIACIPAYTDLSGLSTGAAACSEAVLA